MNHEQEAAEATPSFCRRLDGAVMGIGKAVAWANGLLVVAIILNVVLRYVFDMGQVFIEELQWHLYGLAVMIGLSYSQVLDSPIRVDILHQRFSRRTKAKWEIFGILVFLLPWVVILFLQGIDFWSESWRVNEHSDSPLGLPFRWLIKAVIPISFALLGLATISRLISSLAVIFSDRKVQHGN
jgi:TRAP-type mannitol/chloroaromatic compound transport system permease small subunit